MNKFPQTRLRRLRKTHRIRELTMETRLSVSDFVYPLFVTHGNNVKSEIDCMPGIHQFSLDHLAEEIDSIVKLKIPAVLIFGIPANKDPAASDAHDKNGITQKAIKLIKHVAPELLVIADTCLCEYTNHGHCGVIVKDQVDNDKTLDILNKIAVCQAQAGTDIIAPSAMMDGQVQSIRSALDTNGFGDVPIMAYSAKYASSFYGPFRSAVNSTPKFGNRESYQINPPNLREAMTEIEQDVNEGADVVMVKPALAFLDVISVARQKLTSPIAAYNVSGEYSMVKAAGKMGWIDETLVTFEILTAIKRAGADIIISYHAKEFAKHIQKQNPQND